MVEIVSGVTPFHADDTKSILEKVAKCEPTYTFKVGPYLRLLL